MLGQRLRVLLIEDEPGDAQLTRLALKESRNPGFIVMHEASLAAAIERVGVSAAFDAVLLDLGLPDCQPHQTLARLLAAVPPMPVVVLTGTDDVRLAEEVLELGAQDYLLKEEAGPRTLARAIRNAILRFRSERERLALADTLAAEYDRMADELSSARNMQFDLLPKPGRLEGLRDSHGLAIDGFFRPSSDIGGDLWGCLEAADGCLAVYALDFSGHGVGAALNVFRLHTLIAEMKGQAIDPAAALGHLNTALHGLLPRGHYATFVMAVIDPAAGRLRWAGAGAPRPLFFEPGGTMRWLDTRGRPVGLLGRAGYVNHETDFPPGSCLFLYSDAMTEAFWTAGGMVEEDGLYALLARHHTPGSGLDVPAMVKDFLDRVQTPLGDDMTAVAVTRRG
jgi:sigma-B regulation protein RsbU (phosphoserine phosphatase)